MTTWRARGDHELNAYYAGRIPRDNPTTTALGGPLACRVGPWEIISIVLRVPPNSRGRTKRWTATTAAIFALSRPHARSE